MAARRHLTLAERREAGKAARASHPRSGHAEWTPPRRRSGPVKIVTDENRSRIKELVPLRMGRMSASAFTFYRGAAAIMASDLASIPNSGLRVQLCGDAHLSNFGVFASPERTVLFDVNDFDETFPGPFEWDVKRLATSLVIAAHATGMPAKSGRTAARVSVEAYRQTMAAMAGTGTLGVWYTKVSEAEVLSLAKRLDAGDATARSLAKARARDSMRELAKLTEVVDGRPRFRTQAPTLVRLEDLATQEGMTGEQIAGVVAGVFRSYRSTLPADRRVLLDRYRMVDVARKVVGVGSVGTRCWVVLLSGRDDADPLMLQIKEAEPSVLDAHLPHSVPWKNEGERVVQGQRLIQAASDIFLGWTKGPTGKHFYVRQLADMKGSANVEVMGPTALAAYGALCGATLAIGHARSGDPVAIASYLGSSDTFDRAVTEFARAYAQQNEADYQAFMAKIASGAIRTEEG